MRHPRTLLGLPGKVWRRLQLYFPFTLVQGLGLAFARWRQLRAGTSAAFVIDARGRDEHRIRDLLLWRPSVLTRGRGVDLGLLLGPSADLDEADRLFSAAVVVPGVRSIALYWDAERLDRDRRLWHRTEGPGALEVSSAASAPERVVVARARGAGPALPPGVLREAQTLLKRHARGGAVVCLNLDPVDGVLRHELLGRLPALKFVDFVSAGESGSANFLLVGDLGLTRHERLALVGAADVYVGRFDELGVAALLASIPTVLLGAGPAEADQDLAAEGRTLWLAGRPGPDDVGRVVQFVDRQARATLGAPGHPAR